MGTMAFAGGLVLTVSLLAAATARPMAERLPPSVAAWLLAAGALALAVASGAVLGLLVVAAAVRTPRVAAIGHESLRFMTSRDRAPLSLGLLAGVLLAVATLAAVRVAWRRGLALLHAYREAGRLPGAGQVVIVEDTAADAYTVPGWPGRIVVTSGMMRALAAREREVLLAHERAHAAGRHYLFAAAARLAVAVNPLLRPLTGAVGYALERWADERAAREVGDRALAARAIARAALATTAAPPVRTTPASALGAVFSPAGPRGAGAAGSAAGDSLEAMREAGTVPRRVLALMRPSPRPAWLLLGTAVVLVMACGLAVTSAGLGLHALIEAAQAAGAY
jgi:Zn-dependent protease with chaperone function